MSRTHLVEIGAIKRIHGVAGEVQLFWLPTAPINETETLESVFIVIDGIPVPFFITTIRGKNTDISIVKFDEVDSMAAADELVGAKVLAHMAEPDENGELFLDDLVGFTVIDKMGTQVGEITAFEEYATNAVFIVKSSNGKEIILPASPELIVDINEETKTITLQIPEGLLDIYLE
jgi:16S rRNA processing protein RimM